MALSVTHAFVSGIADGGDSTLVQPSNWNASHTLTGQLSSAQIDLTMTPTWSGLHTFSNSVTLNDGTTWAASKTLRLGNDLIAAGSGVGGSANENSVALQLTVPTTGATADYEKAGLLVQTATSDRSTSHNFDLTGADIRGFINASNSLGRAWGITAWAGINSGGVGDGLLTGIEIDVDNNGTDQSAINTTTTKIGLGIFSIGSTASTCAIFVDKAPSTWHKCLYMDPAALSAGGTFLELNGKFIVDLNGNVTAGTIGCGAITGSAGLQLASGNFISFTGTPSGSHFSIYGDGGATIVNGPSGGTIGFNINNATKAILQTSGGFSVGTGTDPGSGGIIANSYIQPGVTAVGSLPSPSAGNKGARFFVTDANAAMTAGIGTIVAAGGSNNVPVYSDGTNWRIG